MKEKEWEQETQTQGKENTERQVQTQRDALCLGVHPSTARAVSSCVPAPVCRGRFRILCGHFLSFLPPVSPGDTPASESQEAESCKGHLTALQPTPSFWVRNGRLREGSDSQEVTQQGLGCCTQRPQFQLWALNSSCQLPPLPAEQNVRRDVVLDSL